MSEQEKLTQWHPAFCSAIELTFRDDAEYLQYEREKTLNTKPLEIDLVVIKKTSGIELKHAIGKLFRENNIMEYKSPGDELSLNVLCKVAAYAMLYKAYETEDRKVPFGSLTISLVRMGRPEKLLSQLEELGYTIRNTSPGIYYVTGDTFHIPLQIVVTRELPEADNLWLKAIQNNVNEETAKLLVREFGRTDISEHEKNLIDSVMQVSVSENADLYDNVKEDENMCQALLDLMKPEIDQAVTQAVTQAVDQAKAEGRNELLQYVMNDKHCSEEEAKKIIQSYLESRK